MFGDYFQKNTDSTNSNDAIFSIRCLVLVTRFRSQRKFLNFVYDTLHGTNIYHLVKRKLIFKTKGSFWRLFALFKRKDLTTQAFPPSKTPDFPSCREDSRILSFGGREHPPIDFQRWACQSWCLESTSHTVDGWNPANQLIGSLSHYLQGFSTIPNGGYRMEFLNHHQQGQFLSGPSWMGC